METKLPRPAELLKQYFERRKISKPGFSLRVFARGLNVSHSYLHRLLSGKKPVPINRIQRLSEILGLDAFSQRILESSILTHQMGIKKSLTSMVKGRESSENLDILAYESIPTKDFSILDPWYNLVVLDFLTCEPKVESGCYERIAERLELTAYQVQRSIQKLVEHGYITDEGGVLVKTQKKIRFETRTSCQDIRKFHKALLKKAEMELSKIGQEAFEKRFIAGITIAVNPEKIQAAKEILNAALHEIAETLSDGSCSEVYYISGHLFPLTKKD